MLGPRQPIEQLKMMDDSVLIDLTNDGEMEEFCFMISLDSQKLREHKSGMLFDSETIWC